MYSEVGLIIIHKLYCTTVFLFLKICIYAIFYFITDIQYTIYTIFYNVSRFAKSVICKLKILTFVSSSTTFLAHLFGKIDSVLLFCSSRACAATEGSKTARKNQFCQTNVREKLLKDDPNLADSTFCKMTDDITDCALTHYTHFLSCV